MKNKVGAIRTCEFDIMYNEGISLTGDILDIGQEYGVIKRTGNSYSYGDRSSVWAARTRAYSAAPVLISEIGIRCEFKTKENRPAGVVGCSVGQESDETRRR